jgi:hypothetical protein
VAADLSLFSSAKLFHPCNQVFAEPFGLVNPGGKGLYIFAFCI